MISRYQFRLFISFLLVLLCSLAVLLPLGLWRLRDFGQEQLASQLKGQAQLMADSLPPMPKAGFKPGDPGLGSFVRRNAALAGCRVTFIAQDGQVLADSEVPAEGLEGLENHASRAEVAQARAQGFGTAVRHSATVGRDLLYGALALPPRAGQGSVLRLALPLNDVQELTWRLREALLAGLLVAVLLGILLSYGLARRHARAVKALSQAATQVAQGDFNLDLDAAQGAGLDALALSLSSMAGQLKDSFESLRAEQGLMDATLSGMEEAVLALDREGQVLLLNPAGERLLGLSLGEARGKPVIHAVRNSDLARLLSAAGKAPEQGVAGEMMVPGKPERHFSVTIHSLPPALGGAARTVVVLSDITELKRLLALRSEFAANVSHELKTPLTAIRAVLETLADGALEDPSVNRDFLAKALRHTERLSLLIDDILTLSGIEEKSRRGQVEAQGSCLVEEAYGQALGLVEGKAKARSIRVVAQLPQSLPQAAMNSGALCRVLVNLLDNAVKYSPEQGTVAFQARAAEGGLRLEVSDQGPGIAAGEQARLFERFYRPDKARSRDQGGTGLGLAIVKHLVEGVGGRVGVESALGKGSRFWVWLPEPKA